MSELLSQSYKVVMAGANQKEVDDGIAYMKDKNIEVIALVCDVLQQEDIDNLAKTAAAAGNIKGLVAVTGLSPICGVTSSGRSDLLKVNIRSSSR